MSLTKEIITLSLDSIIPYAKNPRDNDETVPFLINSMQKHGYNSLIEVNEEHVVLVGHTRLKALKKLHLDNKLGKGKLKDTTDTNVKVILIKGLTEAEQREYRLANNKVGEQSGWLFNELNIELKEIKELDPLFDGADFGFMDYDEPEIAEPQGPRTIEISDTEEEDDGAPTVLSVFFDDAAQANELCERLKNEGYRCKLS